MQLLGQQSEQLNEINCLCSKGIKPLDENRVIQLI